MRQYQGTLAIQRFDRTEALHDGRVTLDGIMTCQVLPGVGVKGLLDGVFEAAEIPLAHYAFLKDRGDPFTAIPVFPDRIFVQRYVLTTRNSGIRRLEDLAGRRVAVPMYYMTSSLWHRGILEDETGIAARDVHWVTTAPERDRRMSLPDGVTVDLLPGPHLGLERLLDGTADCLMTEASPIVPPGREEDVITLHSDARQIILDYFAETQIHPIVHVIALQAEWAEKNPHLVRQICRGFDRAKQAAYSLLQNERITSLPLMRTHLDETEQLFGRDPWPYGVNGRNRHELDVFLGYAHAQTLTRSRLTVDELFDAEASRYPWSAQMTPGADLAAMESLVGAVL